MPNKPEIYGFDQDTARQILEKTGLVRRTSRRSQDYYQPTNDDTFWVEITDSAEGSDGTWKHASKLKRRSGDTWEDLAIDGGSEATTLGTTDTGYVIMPDGSQLANGTIVLVKITPVTGGTADIVRSYTVIAGGGGSLPEGQYQFMVLQMVTQNAIGYDYMRAHPVTDHEIDFIQNNAAEITTVANAGPQNVQLANAFGGF